MVKVKICGITCWRDAKAALDAGADALGFNFYPPSPRFIPPRRAREIVRRLPRNTQAVGVFVDEPLENVLEIARVSGVRFLQLHGRESPATVAALGHTLPVIKAFRVRPGFRLARLASYPRAKAFLLDGFHRTLRGGTGRAFDWSVAKRAKRYGRIYLSGGLTSENVAQAIRHARPFAVDVASGVEAQPGKKDPARVRAFVQAAKAAG